MEPQLARKMILAGTGPARGEGISKVARVTCDFLTRQDLFAMSTRSRCQPFPRSTAFCTVGLRRSRLRFGPPTTTAPACRGGKQATTKCALD
jgi:hypothetical protein